MKEGKIIAMLLAGGQGSRLKLLTQKVAKPAVPFGGKYRIIDFPLSNCSNSNIFDVGILTQYKPGVLNSHIGIGSSWDLDRHSGGVRVLPPFMSEKGGRWYKGTANAIYENLNFIDDLDPEFVLVLSGDHIYKMDYSKMLDFHREKGADVTISVVEVPWEETSRFGILTADADGLITDFEEKPEHARSNLASMGIYIFNRASLTAYLMQDELDPESDNDFGKNIIPKMRADGLKTYAYVFEGYWKDVGTVKSYWEANMDLLQDDNTLDLYDRRWKIYSKNRHLPPHYIAPTATVYNSLINEGCHIGGSVENSVLFNEVDVRENAQVHNSVLLSGAVIGASCELWNAVIMEDVVIPDGTVIGTKGTEVISLVSSDDTIEEK